MFRGVILLVDRYTGMNSLVSSYLVASGFDVRCMRSPGEISEQLLSQAHLVLMDIETAGDRLSETARRLNDAGVPLMVLTSEHDSVGRLTALELGAADVMSRPLDMAELTARIKAAMSRTLLSVPFVKRPVLSFGGLTADITQYRVTLDGEPLDMPPREIALLYLLMSCPGRVCTRAELSRQLGSSGSERTVNLYISRLKKRIGRYSGNITAVRGVGYKFSEEPST